MSSKHTSMLQHPRQRIVVENRQHIRPLAIVTKHGKYSFTSHSCSYKFLAIFHLSTEHPGIAGTTYIQRGDNFTNYHIFLVGCCVGTTHVFFESRVTIWQNVTLP